jgi:hypothetical protein
VRSAAKRVAAEAMTWGMRPIQSTRRLVTSEGRNVAPICTPMMTRVHRGHVGHHRELGDHHDGGSDVRLDGTVSLEHPDILRVPAGPHTGRATSRCAVECGILLPAPDQRCLLAGVDSSSANDLLTPFAPRHERNPPAAPTPWQTTARCERRGPVQAIAGG